MKFIALKTKDGELKGDIAFFCRILHVSRQGFYQYLANKDRPWKYQPLADTFLLLFSSEHRFYIHPSVSLPGTEHIF